jgi:hypothetical protein
MFTRRKLMTVTALTALGYVGSFANATADTAKVDEKDKADPKAEDYKGSSDPAHVPLQVRLIARKTEYTLDLGGKTADELRKLIDESKATPRVGPAMPGTPAVDLLLELRNTSNEEVTLRIGRGRAQPWISLQGPGALNIETPNAYIARRVVLGENISIAPGKTYSYPIKDLAVPATNVGGHNAYWTQPGEYELTAHFWTLMLPQPANSPALNYPGAPAGGMVTFASAPIKVKVVEKK